MRMRKVKWAVDYLEEAKHLIRDPENKKGSWKKILNTSTLHVEIGAGKGKYSLDMAKMYPDEGFIAIEKNESAAGIAAKKYDEHISDEKLLLLHQDAAEIENWFKDKEVDVIHLNFSDPWPKKRYAKRRLSSAKFLEQYSKILSDDGRIEMKTDNPDLFEYSVPEFSKAGFIIDEMSVDYHRKDQKQDALSEYETKFVAEGKPIYRVVIKKNLKAVK